MARFIEIPINGNFPKIGTALVSANNTLFVFSPAGDNGTKTQIRLETSGGAGGSRIELTHAADTQGKIKDAINKALLQNPNGSKGVVQLPDGFTITNIQFLG